MKVRREGGRRREGRQRNYREESKEVTRLL